MAIACSDWMLKRIYAFSYMIIYAMGTLPLQFTLAFHILYKVRNYKTRLRKMDPNVNCSKYYKAQIEFDWPDFNNVKVTWLMS